MSNIILLEQRTYLRLINGELNRIAKENNAVFEISTLQTTNKSFSFINPDNNRRHMIINISSKYTLGDIIWRKAHELAHVLLGIYNPKDTFISTMEEKETLVNIRALSLVRILWCAELNISKTCIKSIVTRLGLPRIVYELLIYLNRRNLKLSNGNSKRLRNYIKKEDSL